MYAFLTKSFDPECDTKDDHKAMMESLKIDTEFRRECRAELQSDPAAADLVRKERPLDTGIDEPPEPEDA